jgi:hypothetical protein
MTTGSLEASDAASAAVQKTPHRVTLDSMKSRIVDEEYIHPELFPKLTICCILLDNGFVLVGKSAPADPGNFNEELGRNFAKDDALRQMWPLEGYLLCEKLTAEEAKR